MTKILALSARKQGGKNTAANFLVGLEMVSQNLIEYFKIDEQGRLIVPTLFKGEEKPREGVIDVSGANQYMNMYLSDTGLSNQIKCYSFASYMKDVSCNLFDVPRELVWGTNENKSEQIPHVLWENMPGKKTSVLWDGTKLGSKSGPMSGREFLQYFGTEILRHIYPKCHAVATIKQIRADNPELAIITDCRFPDEIEVVRMAGGKVLRLTRKLFDDMHESETALDSYEGFDAIIDNQNISIEECHSQLFKILVDWGYIVDNNVS